MKNYEIRLIWRECFIIDMNESTFIEKINEIGGKVYLVGGAVRDKFRDVEAHDKDYCAVGITEDKFNKAFPKAFKVGNSFPVYKVLIDDKDIRDKKRGGDRGTRFPLG